MASFYFLIIAKAFSLIIPPTIYCRRICAANFGFPIHSGSHCFSIDRHRTF
jgi:hypothetical protein